MVTLIQMFAVGKSLFSYENFHRFSLQTPATMEKEIVILVIQITLLMEFHAGHGPTTHISIT